MRSVNRTPSRWVLVLKSARCKSALPGFAGDLPNTDSTQPASNPKNQPVLVESDMRYSIAFSRWQVPGHIIIFEPHV